MRKVKSSAVRESDDIAAPPADLAQAAAAMGAMSAGPAPVGPAKMTRLEGPAAEAFAAASLGGTHLEAGPAPVRAGARGAAEDAKRPARRSAVRPASPRRRPTRK
jgi:hypothetical protein